MDVKQYIENPGKGLEGIESHLESLNDNLNIFREVPEIEKGKGKFEGLPFSVKDSICVEGALASAGSKILENYRPPFDSTAVKRTKERGGTFIGKTNMDEFGFGTFSTNCAFEVPKNPWDTERATGGSSGGAAALTSAIEYPHVALGQSTGGSISCPASFSGVVGLTPTYGRVSRYGLISYGNSLDKIGPIGKRVYDVALLLDAIKGKDPKDQTSVSREDGSFVDKLNPDKIEGMKIGVPEEYMEFEGIDHDVRETIWSSIKTLEDLGASYEKVKMPKIHKKYSVPSYYIIAMAEASTNLAKYSGIRYGMEGVPDEKSFNEYFSEIRSKGFGEEAKRRILIGTFARMAGYRDQYYLKALKVRTLVINEFKRAFKNYDLLASPAMPMVAPRFDEIEELSPMETYAMDTLTIGPNLAGIPHISVPSGFVNEMPVGMHLIGDHFEEQNVLNAARAFERKKDLNLNPEVLK